MSMLKLSALPLAAFMGAAIWGAAAMVPFAPGPDEDMFWIPVSLALTSAAIASVAAILQDMFLFGLKRWRGFSKAYPSLCSELVPFVLFPIGLTLSGAAAFDPILLSSVLLLIGLSFGETLTSAAYYRARAMPTALVVFVECSALVFAAYMYRKGVLTNVSVTSRSWFATSVASMGLLSFLVGRYWTNLLRDSEVKFSPLLKRLLVTFIAEGSTTEWSQWRLKQRTKKRKLPQNRSKSA
ncbi:hypothetical protein CXF96_08590 [Stenotrophomonas sp. Betaine-02u-21]|uniref:hypothetical protein n=1 Tax=unclassified Stenotrophomonas TaxID=196198 RepID=UPI000C341888|nr:MULTISPECIES: hypothetical protein [unclassified Stenotrophomonas]PKH70139.1 hypothetical protein CXF90_16190 [Stenotrophomonas sp. Betaine-02u-23]PKH74359.1 hypothetical protein CXF96_08590 [Stenotrophomonas sp. Betaine-02u-21]PKH96568.1 hypothetical protein CXG43_06625 [Stenotrophomonas sp. Bg11-02]